ncbi:MAG: hypothetical protein RM049_22665 [Nostoc sp. DedQUE04]|uniref:hypothetical protein n=1 Tax=Nostoc sp. DedQUE04 TaxID=3075390 RepID=UPI002AD4DD39|nr:hypothetical protein [Nostoc sp. DedQUE04]MDZ8138073.1 hypothetical protein [Nostoc sp. DedQUE04]
MTPFVFKLQVDILNHPYKIDIKNNEVIPTLSYKAIKKAIQLLQPWVNHLLKLYGVSEADIADIMPLLLFVEATIYQIDEDNEIHEDINKNISVLRNVLTQLNLFDDALETRLQQGLTYYDLETQFCSGKIPTQENIDFVCIGKPFDFGILHRLFFKLTSHPDEEMLGIYPITDQIGEIISDLKSYKEDIERNVMNIYRMFVRLYGSEAPQQLQQYLEKLNSQLQYQLKFLKQTRPDMAGKFIIYWNNIFPGDCPIPEIPAPILEEGNLVAGSTAAYTT